jgi:hypothetical protein
METPWDITLGSGDGNDATPRATGELTVYGTRINLESVGPNNNADSVTCIKSRILTSGGTDSFTTETGVCFNPINNKLALTRADGTTLLPIGLPQNLPMDP